MLAGVALLVFVGALFTVFFNTATNTTGSARPGVLHTETQTFPVSGVSSANIDLRMSAGNINVAGGATGSDLASATFSYNIDQWKPEVTYSAQGGKGALQVRQPNTNLTVSGDTRNRWDLQLRAGVPSTVKANLTAGNIDMVLGGLNVTKLTVDNNAGNIDIDLIGQWHNDLEATITGNVGNTTLRLPGDVGVRVTTKNDLGNVTASGLHADGAIYTNDAYGKSSVTLNIEVSGKVGNIILHGK